MPEVQRMKGMKLGMRIGSTYEMKLSVASAWFQ
jgi:hypothetical protein